MKTADYLISSSSILGERAGFSKFVIGLTLVAIGTSLPELFTAIIAILSSADSAAFVFGTVIGSNISNILLIFGILILFSKNFKVNLKFFDIFFLLISVVSLCFIIYIGSVDYIYGVTFLLLFLFYLFSVVKFGSKDKFIDEVKGAEDTPIMNFSTYYLIIIFILALIGLNISAKAVVFSITNLGILLKIPIEFLTLTTVAFATSLPEMVVTIQSARKNELSLAVGNIIGSNISNVFLIIGVSGILKTITFNSGSYLIGIYIMLLATLSFVILINKKEVKKYHAYILFLIYVIYLYLVF